MMQASCTSPLRQTAKKFATFGGPAVPREMGSNCERFLSIHTWSREVGVPVLDIATVYWLEDTSNFANTESGAR